MTNLKGADLSGANLSGTDLSKANLSGAILSDTILTDANLSNADISHADLSQTELSEAKVSTLDFFETQMDPEDLEDIRQRYYIDPNPKIDDFDSKYYVIKKIFSWRKK